MEKAVLLNTAPTWAPVRANSVANQIVMQVREALFEGRFQPGDLLGSEKDLAAQFDVSRITVRDALRTLETMGIIEIRVGAGGGARIAQGNLEHYSDSLSIQFKLSGITEQEILDLQIAIEGAAVELAASKRNQADL
ncbi:MAG: Pyruvate dehydrogenase complex repressor, partial [Alphaproteobacteria bacterium MarineAlpha3_Bin5]